MVIINRNTRKELKRIAAASGYDYKFLKGIYKESVEDDGEADMRFIEDVSMERDW